MVDPSFRKSLIKVCLAFPEGMPLSDWKMSILSETPMMNFLRLRSCSKASVSTSGAEFNGKTHRVKSSPEWLTSARIGAAMVAFS
jgi:hypothetical protein